MAFAIKAEVRDPRAKTFAFTAQNTMYGGKHIAKGDTVFVFASENEGGQGLVARGIVTSAEAIAKKRGDRPADAAREHRRQTHRAREAATRTERAQALYRLERRPAEDRAQFQILSSGDQQDRRDFGKGGRISGSFLLGWRPLRSTARGEINAEISTFQGSPTRLPLRSDGTRRSFNGGTRLWLARRATLRPAHRSHLAALAAAAEEPVAAVGLEPRHADAGRHLDASPAPRPVRGSMRRSSLSSPSQVPCQSSPSTQVTPVTKRLDSMVRRTVAGLGIDLVDLPVAILADPERALGPGQPGVAAAAGRRDRREHAAGLRIDLLDAVLGDLEQVLAVEGRAGMRGDVDRAHASCRSPDRRRSACRRRRTRRAGRR